MRLVLLSTGVFSGILFSGLMTGLAHADLHYGCMAEDAHVKLALHVEFSSELGGRLSHMSGHLSVVADGAPPELAAIRISSDQVTQMWSDRDHVMLRFFNEAVSGGPVFIRLSTEATGVSPGPLVGTYRIDQPREGGEAFQLSGRAICQNDTEGQAAGN